MFKLTLSIHLHRVSYVMPRNNPGQRFCGHCELESLLVTGLAVKRTQWAMNLGWAMNGSRREAS